MVNDEDVGFSKCKLRVNAFPGSLCKESNFCYLITQMNNNHLNSSLLDDTL